VYRRKFLSHGACAASALFFGVDKSDAESEKITLNRAKTNGLVSDRALRGMIPDGSQDSLATIAARWTKETGQPVELTIVPVDDINSRMTMDGLTDNLDFDFALPATFGISDLIVAGVVQPFDKLRDTLGMNAREEGSLYSIGDFVGEQRYGFQTDGDVYLMFYRADMLDDTALKASYRDLTNTPLTLPGNWEILDKQMEFFHKPSIGRFGGALFRIPGYLGWEFFARLYDEQGEILTDELEPLFDNDVAEQALENMRRATDFLHPATASAGLFENWSLYKAENIYANIGWGGSQKSFNRPDSPIRGKLRHATLPGLSERGLSYFNWGWSYVVPTTATQPELGYLFSRFAVSEQMSTQSVREIGGYFDPFQAIHYDDPEIISAYSKPFLDVHQAAMRLGRRNLVIPGHGAYMASLNRNLSRALNGSLTARQALRIIESEWELTTLEFGREDQIKRWNDLAKN